MARGLGISHQALHSAYLNDTGTGLAQQANGACVFLADTGCAVHADRPLVCRLYPLGRHVDSDGSESFSRLAGHPQSAGSYGGPGKIADYLREQGAAPFMTAADAYFLWLCRATERVAKNRALSIDPSIGSQTERDGDIADPFDLDGSVSAYCVAGHMAEPSALAERMALHLHILDIWIDRSLHEGEGERI